MEQYWQQTLLPRSGCMQAVRTADGTEHQALILAGSSGWRDGGYKVVPGIVEWFKPAKWFCSADDLVGDEQKMHEARHGKSWSRVA